MIELILLVGLVWLFVLHTQLLKRVGLIEQELGDLRDGVPAAAKPEARISSPARVVQAATTTFVGTTEEVDHESEKEADTVSSPAIRETLATMFERFVGGRLLIWIGGIALAVAGIFLIRYSIEIGLITPSVRMVMAGLFGMILLAAGEFIRSKTDVSGDVRTPQALVGAGILVLYATPYGALVLYQLISLGTASALMVAVTAMALILSLRHGAPAAVMGLAGGFATPLLVGDPDAGALPLLFYLALLNVAIFVIAQRRGWAWLAAGAVALSFAWTGALLLAPPDDALAAGLFILALGISASLLKAGEGRQIRLLRPAAIGLVELAVLVGRTDLGLPAWGLYGALALASLFLSTRRPDYRLLPPVALVLALVLLAGKAVTGEDPLLLWVAAAITLLFGCFASAGALRDSKIVPTMTAAAAWAAPVIILRAARPETLDRPLWGVLMILIAAAPAFLAWHRRGADKDGHDWGLTVAAGTALLLLGIAASDLVPRDLLGSIWLALAIGAALAGRRLAASGLSWLALAAAGLATSWSIAMVPEYWATLLLSLAGDPALATNLPDPVRTLPLLVLPAPLLFLLWHSLPTTHRFRPVPLGAAILFLAVACYIFFKQTFGLASLSDFVARGFAERMLITQALFVAGWFFGTPRIRIPGLEEAMTNRIGTALTALAAARLVWFDMLLHNPVFTAQSVGSLPIFNLLLPCYLLGAFWLYGFRRRAGSEAVSGLWLSLFFAALVSGVMLMVRQVFQGAILTAPFIPAAESYGYSLAGLLVSIGLLLAGIRLPDKALRLAGLCLLTATICKVFLIDASVLDGLLRILSFLGLGVALIGIGKLYSAVLNAEVRLQRSV